MPALANVALTDTFDTWRIRTNQIIVKGNDDEVITTAAFTKANTFNNVYTTIAGANTAVGAGANAYAAAATAGANAYMISVQNGSNTAVGAGANAYAATAVSDVGAGANAYASATIAGANTAVGAGANAYMISVQNGSNTAVGAGANAYSLTLATAGNNFTISLQNGSNTAVGTGANAYAAAAAAGANAYMISVQNGSNTAVGAGANAYSDTKLANTSGVSFNGNINFVGNVGIRGAASYDLDVTGNTRITRALGVGTPPSATTGEIRATNNITAYYSDKRLKEILYTIPNPLEKLLFLSGVIFRNNDLASEYGYDNREEQVGVIAQEVEEVLPQIVKLAPFDTEYIDGKEVSKSGENFKTVQYDKLIPLLIEAIKEQQKQINELKASKFCSCPTTDKS